MTFIAAQLGARRHYAVPRLLHAEGALARLFTDICAVRGWPKLFQVMPQGLRIGGLKRLLNRVPHGIPADRITALTGFGWEYARRRWSATSPAEARATNLWGAREFCGKVVRRSWGQADAVFTYSAEGLEILCEARRRGFCTVMDQTIAPMPVERRLLEAECETFPDWEPGLRDPAFLEEYMARERAEWAEADLIFCGSEFVRDGIRECGGPVERCVVVPYGVDSRFHVPECPRHSGPIRVLTVGEVGLRKGSPYVLEAAKQLNGTAHFRMVGPLSVRPGAVKQLAQHVEVIGPVARSEILPHFAWADVLLLPSLCEGSAAATYEALACGLPVIATPNTGSIVRDGIEGFLVPIRNAEAIAERVGALAGDPDLLDRLSQAARQRAEHGTLTAYAQRFREALRTLGSNR